MKKNKQFLLNRETIFTCPHTLKFRTRPLAGTASGMASDSVRGRGMLNDIPSVNIPTKVPTNSQMNE